MSRRHLLIYFMGVLALAGILIGSNIMEEMEEIKDNLEEMGVVVQSGSQLLEIVIEDEESDSRVVEKLSRAYEETLLSHLASKKLDYLSLEIYRGDKLIKDIEVDRKNIKDSGLKDYYYEGGEALREELNDKIMVKLPGGRERYFVHSESFHSERYRMEMILASDTEVFISELKEDIFEMEKVFFCALLIIAPLLIRMNMSRRASIRRGMTDSLTGLYNRRVYPLVVESIKKKPESMWMIFYMDLDGLKNVNDLLGHAEGDLYLRKFSKMLKKVFRESDYKIRIGGDEFIAAGRISDTISCEKIKKRLVEESKKYSIPFSMGVITFRGGDVEKVSDLEEKIIETDKLMYRNKLSRKSRPGIKEVSWKTG